MKNEEVKEKIEELASALFGDEDLVKIKALAKAQAVITDVCSSWQNEKQTLKDRVAELEKELESLKKNETPKQETSANVEEKAEKPAMIDGISITRVEVWPFKEGPSLGRMKGLASVVINDSLLIRSLRIMEGENGLFVGYPNDPLYKGEEFRAIVSPITRSLRELIENAVLEKFSHANI